MKTTPDDRERWIRNNIGWLLHGHDHIPFLLERLDAARAAKGVKLTEEQRQSLGEALTDKLSDMQGGDTGPDWFDSRIMDEVLDVIEQTLVAGVTEVPRG